MSRYLEGQGRKDVEYLASSATKYIAVLTNIKVNPSFYFTSELDITR